MTTTSTINNGNRTEWRTSYGITTCVSLPLFWRSGNIYSVNCYSLRAPTDSWLFLFLRPVTLLLLFFQSPWMAQWVAPGKFTSKGLDQNFPLASLTCFSHGVFKSRFSFWSPFLTYSLLFEYILVGSCCYMMLFNSLS